MAPWVNGLVGLVLSAWVGTRFAGLSPGEIAWALVAANIAGLISVITILQLEWRPWIKRHVLTRSRRTWPLFAAMHYGIQLALVPPLRDGQTFLLMLIPLLLGTGFLIPVFGPIQDQLYRRSQRRARLKKL